MSPSPPAGAREAFKTAFTRFAATVSVISYRSGDGEPAGMTATSMCSLSLDPLSLLVCVNRENRSHADITGTQAFGINMLAVEQQNIADHCSRPGAVKRLRDAWLRDEDRDVPVIDRCLAHLGCVLAQTHDASTHSIFIGHVNNVWIGPDRPPLMYANRSYRRFDPGPDPLAMQRIWDRVAFGSLS